MNKHRLNLVSKESNLVMNKENLLDQSLEHLEIAHNYLSIYLNGKNHYGLLTNISNSRYEIKRFLKNK
jgi:hypothetical protein